MFNLNDSMRYYLYPYPTDMRKSFYTLSGVVKDLMGKTCVTEMYLFSSDVLVVA